jgi:hypothetical protein
VRTGLLSSRRPLVSRRRSGRGCSWRPSAWQTLPVDGRTVDTHVRARSASPSRSGPVQTWARAVGHGGRHSNRVDVHPGGADDGTTPAARKQPSRTVTSCPPPTGPFRARTREALRPVSARRVSVEPRGRVAIMRGGRPGTTLHPRVADTGDPLLAISSAAYADVRASRGDRPGRWRSRGGLCTIGVPPRRSHPRRGSRRARADREDWIDTSVVGGGSRGATTSAPAESRYWPRRKYETLPSPLSGT